MSGAAGWAWPARIAHRCGGALAPENSLAGLDVAARLGMRAVEFDVMLSADGVPLLLHDEALARTAGIAADVPALPARTLLATDIGASHHRAFRGECIPSLEAALERCRALGLAANLEIKPAAGLEAETGARIGALLAALPDGRRPSLLLSSFSAVALRAAAGCVPALPRGLLADAFAPETLVEARALGCASLHLADRGLAERHVRAAGEAGLRVLAYTVDSPSRAAELDRWNVAGVFTDRPDRVA